MAAKICPLGCHAMKEAAQLTARRKLRRWWVTPKELTNTTFARGYLWTTSFVPAKIVWWCWGRKQEDFLETDI